MSTLPRFLRPLQLRDPAEPHRTASPLELFFDLVFVIAISISGGHFHHALVEGHVGQGILGFLMVFQCIWWAWMNFTWFSTSFDNDDALYRTLTFVQMFGVIVLAVGSDAFFTGEHLFIPVVGFVIMRIALVIQWLRAARIGGDAGRAARTYAFGLMGAQALWVVWALLPPGPRMVAFVVFTVIELSIPLIAERRGRTAWHPHHITERYGLFTIIILGESLLASANAIADALAHPNGTVPNITLVGLALAALTIAAGMWWLYFWPAHHVEINGFLRSLRYGYGHAFVFGAAAAVSVGIESTISAAVGHTELSAWGTRLTVGIPVALFLLGVWLLLLRGRCARVVSAGVVVAAVLVLLLPVWGIALVMALLIGLLTMHRAPSAGGHGEAGAGAEAEV